MTEAWPPLNHTLSPYTGWTREHWEAIFARLTYGYVLAAEKNGSPARALYPDDRRNLPDATDALESFARIASAWGAWLRNPANPASVQFAGRDLNIEALLRSALLEGTDPANPYTYWGGVDHLSQHIVEAADMAVAIWLSRERVFDRLSQVEQAQVIAWLAQVDGKGTYYDNWILFSAMAQMVRLRLGYPVSEAELDFRLDEISAFYRGDGWYVDGDTNEFELYNAWMFGWHYLLWAWIDGDRRPRLRQQVLDRARSFIAGFQYFFGANGAYPAWGRSIVYRFAALAVFATGYLHRITPDDPGRLRRLSSGCIRYFYERGMFDPDEHFLRQGFHGDFPPAGETYISPGSPYWACHGLFALTFDRDDPFWTATEAPLPVERADFDLALPAPGFAISGRRETGQVILLNGRSGQEYEVVRYNYTAKYGKFAYTTHFPFNVSPAAASHAPDAMLALVGDDGVFGHRTATRAASVAPGMIWCEFNEIIRDQLQKLRAAVCLWRDLQIRLAFVLPSLPVRAFEAPGALGCAGAAGVRRRSDPAAGWEYAEAEGRAVGIRRLWGYDTQQPSMPFLGYSNINVAYPYAELPLVGERASSAAARGFAAASLVRPAPFDPAGEFEGLSAAADSRGNFRAALSDGEQIFAALGFDPPQQVEVGGAAISGPAVLCVRVKPDAAEICGLGLEKIAGVAELARPGALRLRRLENSAAQVTTGAGFSLSPDWLGGPARRVEVQTLGGDWADVTGQCAGNQIPQRLVDEWSESNQRTLLEFRVAA